MLVFVSYKSEDANLVRGVAERMTANGVSLWFAEYEVLPETYERFQEAIDEGIQNASHGLIFTNARWADSEYCRYEMAHLLERIPPGKITEVCIPKESEPGEIFPLLAESRRVVFEGNHVDPQDPELDKLVREISTELDLDGSQIHPPVTSGDRISLQGFGVEFDPGPFLFSPTRTQQLQTVQTRALRTAVFRAPMDGVDVNLDLHVWPLDTAVGGLSVPQGGQGDDRQVYTAYRKYARDWLRSESQKRGEAWEAKGLHLIFIDGRSHLGLTYVTGRFTREEALWERRYVISLPSEGDERQGEAGLVFAARMRGDPEAQLRRFCRLTPQMDTIARSFRVISRKRKERFWSLLPLIAVRVILAVAIAAGGLHLHGLGAGTATMVALALLVGYSLADLVNVVFRPTYRRLLLTMHPLADDVEEPGFTRTAMALVHEFMGWPIYFFSNLFTEPLKLVRPSGLRWLTLLLAVGAAGWFLLVEAGRVFPEAFFVAAAGCVGALVSVSAVQSWISSKRRTGRKGVTQRRG